jgi:hypothetical protein
LVPNPTSSPQTRSDVCAIQISSDLPAGLDDYR